MKGAYHDPVDHARTTQPHAGESFIDTLWWPGLFLLALGIIAIAGCVATTAYRAQGDWPLILGLIAGALVTGGALLIAAEHRRVKKVERRWLAEHPRLRPPLAH
ncbi:MAG: protein UsfY [Mycobacterium sp.]